MRIDACFDSHVHWAATGEFSRRLILNHLTSGQSVQTLSREASFVRSDWRLGFGWDDQNWPEPAHRMYIDAWESDLPVLFSRRDGHAYWLNTRAMELCGLDPHATLDVPAPQTPRDASGALTGVFIDHAMALVDARRPAANARELRRDLLKGVQLFNEAGFTHIRDMTCDDAQWAEAVHLDESGLLTLAVDAFFWARTPDEVERTIESVKHARSSVTPNVRAQGVKFFVDGSLGANGAWLSRCYHGHDHSGHQLWSAEALTMALRLAWQAQLEVAVHAIGDAAVALTVECARAVFASGLQGRLNIEHGQIIRPETIEAMKSLDVVVHLQPSHWLSDREWLNEKLGPLASHAFPWRRLQENDIAIQFGSDAPIEIPSVSRTLEALRLSAEAGIPRLLGSPTTYMRHPDPAWAPNSFTLFSDDRPTQIIFRGEHLS